MTIKKRRKLFTKEQREKILKRTDYRCYSCGMKMSLEDDWWIEHILPHSHDGSDNIENLLPSCRLCNWVRSNYSPERIRRLLTIGYTMIHEVDKKTNIGLQITDAIKKREERLKKRRKHEDLAMNHSAKNTIRSERNKM